MEIKATLGDMVIYDDFAHHPTAIATTLEGLRARVGDARIIAILEPRSNTMRMGVHAGLLGESLRCADIAVICQTPDLGWNAAEATASAGNVQVHHSVDSIIKWLEVEAAPGDHILFMSNGSFGGIHLKAEEMLRQRNAG
jgi:UDP-N-acetylmuramate: L-alanyl-gamma-D-glutamyl-meso-diaminopimelate ligase